MSIFDEVTKVVVNDGQQRKRGDRVRLMQTSRIPPEFRLSNDPNGGYTFLEACPLQIHGAKLMRVTLVPGAGAPQS